MSISVEQLESLYESAHAVPDSLTLTNKYTYAISIGLLEGRYLNVNDAFTNSSFLTSYITKKQEVLLFPNYINNQIVGMFIKPLHNNITPLKLGFNSLIHGIGQLSQDFKYGDTLYVVEGFGDYAALKLVDQRVNAVITLSNKPSQDNLELIAKLTNKVVMIIDNDKAALKGYNLAKTKLNKLGVDVDKISTYAGHKDIGELLDTMVIYKQTKNLQLKSEIIDMTNYYRACLI